MKLLQVSVWAILLLFTLHPLLAQDLTPEATIEITQPQPTATLGGIPLKFITGQARYQNRLPDHAAIDIQILDNDLSLLAVAVTDAQGVYTVTAPIDAFYWLVASAPLHKRVTIPVQPGETVPDLILAGGDLTQDGCIGQFDVALLVSQLDLVGAAASDITGDGVTDVADLAIITGNFDPNCEAAAVIEVTEEATEEATQETAPESTVEVTAEVTPENTEEVVVTLEVTAEITPEATSEITPEFTPESTEEATSEVTPEITPEPPATSTPENMAEATLEVTAETATPTAAPESTEEVMPTSTPLPTPTPTPTVTFTPVPSVTFTPLPTVTEETTVEASAGD